MNCKQLGEPPLCRIISIGIVIEQETILGIDMIPNSTYRQATVHVGFGGPIQRGCETILWFWYTQVRMACSIAHDTCGCG